MVVLLIFQKAWFSICSITVYETPLTDRLTIVAIIAKDQFRRNASAETSMPDRDVDPNAAGRRPVPNHEDWLDMNTFSSREASPAKRASCGARQGNLAAK